jgi:hypothetical protein
MPDQRFCTHIPTQPHLNPLSHPHSHLQATLFGKGVAQFPRKDQEGPLKHLLKDLGEPLVNILFELWAGANLFALDASAEITKPIRDRIINAAVFPQKGLLSTLDERVSGKDLDAFFEALDVALEDAGMYVKKTDKKRDKSLAGDSPDTSHPLLLSHSSRPVAHHPLILRTICPPFGSKLQRCTLVSRTTRIGGSSACLSAPSDPLHIPLTISDAAPSEAAATHSSQCDSQLTVHDSLQCDS